MPYTYRIAQVEDIPDLMSIRNNVRENALVSTVLMTEDYVEAITIDGRAWLCEAEGATVGFVCGRFVQSDIWALFVCPSHEGCGIGRALMDIVESWMFGEGIREVRLVTSPGTRAERLYRERGWISRGLLDTGEAEYFLKRSHDLKLRVDDKLTLDAGCW